MKFSKEIIVKLVKTIVSFILAKGTTFFAPIVLLKFVTIEDYGLIEYSYSMGSVLAIVVSLGLYGAYPYFILKKNEEDKEQVFLSYGILAFLIVLLSLILFYSNTISRSCHFIILFSIIFAIQRLYSSKLKSEDKGFLGVLVDSGYYFLLALIILLSFIFHLSNVLEILLHLMGIYAIIFSVLLIILFLEKRTLVYRSIVFDQLPEILSFSYKMILSGFIVYWLTSSARIYINWFMGYDQVGIFSFYFRMAGISVAMYLFIAVTFFKTLYTLNANKMDKYYSLIMICIVLGCGFCYLLLPYTSRLLNNPIPVDNVLIYLLLCFQMPIWVGFSLCESIIGRENIVNKFNCRVGILIALFPLVLLFFKESLNLELYCFLNTILFFLAFSIQLFLLSQKKIVLKRTMMINIIMCIGSSITYYVNC